jgi:hypothetical protein
MAKWPRGEWWPGTDRERTPRDGVPANSLFTSLLRLDGHTNIAAANRHHARDPQRTLKLLHAA